MHNATEMLHEEYAEIVDLFSRFDDADTDDERLEIIDGTLSRLAIVEALEQEIAMPAVRAAVADGEAIETGEEEYGERLKAMREVAQGQLPPERYERFAQLAESVFRHIQLAEDRMLPKLEEIGADELGERMAQRRDELERTRLFL